MVALHLFRSSVLLAVGLCAGSALLVGCSQATPSGSKTVTVTASSTPSTTDSASPTDSAFANSSNASATPSTSVTAAATLGGVCEDLLPASTVNTVVGLPLAGKTAFVFGKPEPTIERLVYLNCRYGIAAPAKGKPAIPKVEIGLSLYASDVRASSRVQGTIADFAGLGAKATAVTVDGKPATILTGYQNPTLVMSVGPRTVAVSVQPKIFGTEQTTVLTGLAKAALDATANFRT